MTDLRNRHGEPVMVPGAFEWEGYGHKAYGDGRPIPAVLIEAQGTSEDAHRTLGWSARIPLENGAVVGLSVDGVEVGEEPQASLWLQVYEPAIEVRDELGHPFPAAIFTRSPSGIATGVEIRRVDGPRIPTPDDLTNSVIIWWDNCLRGDCDIVDCTWKHPETWEYVSTWSEAQSFIERWGRLQVVRATVEGDRVP